jgi:hypothetical protein
MLDFEHLLSVTLAAKSQGAREWRELSRRERAFVSMALNRVDWLSEDELSMGQAMDLIGPDLLALVVAVERAIAG